MQDKPRIDCAGRTDPGRMRKVNEDQFLIAELNRSLLVEQTSLALQDHTRIVGQATARLVVVADGIGGHAFGDRASSLALQAITSYALGPAQCLFDTAGADSDETLREQLRLSLVRCQQAIDADAEAKPEHRNMGTTLTMGCIIWPRMYVVHAGDSRCYLLRARELHRLTRDHTTAQELLDKGVLAPENVGNTPFSHMLSNAIIARDDGESVHPEVHCTPLQPGDVILLCTDGLTAHVPEAQIAEVLSSATSADSACETLVALANEGGGSDNITVAIGRIADQLANSPERTTA